MDRKTIIIGSSIAFVFILIYFITGITSDSSDKNSDNNDEAIAALFGGGGSSPSSSSSEKSLMGSDFWKAGVPDKAIDTSNVEQGGDDSGLLDPASEGNPVNPQTGQPFPDSVMKQFDSLREKFPGNKIIPRRMSQAEKDAEMHEKLAMQEVQRKISTGEKMSPSEINSYYDFEVNSVDDRLELINYIMESQGDSMDEDIKGKFQKILDLNTTQKTSLETQRKAALENNSAK